jgi:hypothetical protein
MAGAARGAIRGGWQRKNVVTFPGLAAGPTSSKASERQTLRWHEFAA